MCTVRHLHIAMWKHVFLPIIFLEACCQLFPDSPSSLWKMFFGSIFSSTCDTSDISSVPLSPSIYRSLSHSSSLSTVFFFSQLHLFWLGIIISYLSTKTTMDFVLFCFLGEAHFYFSWAIVRKVFPFHFFMCRRQKMLRMFIKNGLKIKTKRIMCTWITWYEKSFVIHFAFRYFVHRCLPILCELFRWFY